MPLLGWILLGGLAVLTAVWLYVWMGNRSHHYRRRPAEFVEDMVMTLAALPEGSVLIIEHEESGRFLQFRKPADTGERAQEVVFGFPEVPWSGQFFERIVDEVARSGRPYELVEPVDGEAAVRFLEVRLEGDRLSLGQEAVSLTRPLLSILEFSHQDRFTFHIDASGWNQELKARVEIDFWRAAAAEPASKWAKRHAQKMVDLGRPKHQ